MLFCCSHHRTEKKVSDGNPTKVLASVNAALLKATQKVLFFFVPHTEATKCILSTIVIDETVDEVITMLASPSADVCIFFSPFSVMSDA